MKLFKRVISLMVCLVIIVSTISPEAYASDFTDLIGASFGDWIAGWSGQNTGV